MITTVYPKGVFRYSPTLSVGSQCSSTNSSAVHTAIILWTISCPVNNMGKN